MPSYLRLFKVLAREMFGDQDKWEDVAQGVKLAITEGGSIVPQVKDTVSPTGRIKQKNIEELARKLTPYVEVSREKIATESGKDLLKTVNKGLALAISGRVGAEAAPTILGLAGGLMGRAVPYSFGYLHLVSEMQNALLKTYSCMYTYVEHGFQYERRERVLNPSALLFLFTEEEFAAFLAVFMNIVNIKNEQVPKIPESWSEKEYLRSARDFYLSKFLMENIVKLDSLHTEVAILIGFCYAGMQDLLKVISEVYTGRLQRTTAKFQKYVQERKEEHFFTLLQLAKVKRLLRLVPPENAYKYGKISEQLDVSDAATLEKGGAYQKFLAFALFHVGKFFWLTELKSYGVGAAGAYGMSTLGSEIVHGV